MNIIFFLLFYLFCILVFVKGKKSVNKGRTVKPRNGHLSGRGIPGDPVNKHAHEGQQVLAALKKVSKHKRDYNFLYKEHEETKLLSIHNDNDLDANTLRRIKFGDKYELEELSSFRMSKKQLDLNKKAFGNYLKHLDTKKLKSSLRGKNNSPNEVLTSSKLLTSKAVTGENTYEIKRNVDSDNQRSLQQDHPGMPGRCREQVDEASCTKLGDGKKCIAEVYDSQLYCTENRCHEDHFNPSICSHNSHCLNADDNGEYCRTTQVPCRDCPQCASVPVCSDMLLQCSSKMDDTTWLQRNVPNSLHPCNNDACAKDKDSSKCENNLYDFCCNEDLAETCNPSAEMKALRDSSPCTPQGCTHFKNQIVFNYDKVDWNSLECSFDDPSICNGECENYQEHIFLELESDVLMPGASIMTESIDVGRNTISYGRKLLDDLKRKIKAPNLFEKNQQHKRHDKMVNVKGGWPSDTPIESPGEAYNYECTDTELEASLEYIDDLGFSDKFEEAGGKKGLDNLNCALPMQTEHAYGDVWTLIGCATTSPDQNDGYDFLDETCERPSSTYESNRNLVCLLDAFNGNRKNPGGMSDEEFGMLVALGDKLAFDCNGIPRASDVNDDDEDDDDRHYYLDDWYYSYHDDWYYSSYYYDWYYSSYYDDDDESQGSYWDYDGVCTQSNDKCGSECCTVLDSIADGSYADKSEPFGTPAGDPYACGQLIDPDNYDLKRCFGVRCKSCYAESSGPLGKWGVSDYDWEVINTRKAREPCAKQINSYCSSSAGLSDTSCQSTCDFDCDVSDVNCPCHNENTCKAFFESPYTQQSACADYKAALTEAYIKQGFLRPSGYNEEWLLEQGSLPYPAADSNAVFDDSDVQSLEASCPQASNLKLCMPFLLDHCNSDHAWYSDACASLSICGDGLVTWGEICDDGGYNTYSTGCDSCVYIDNDDERACKPGQVCELCTKTSGNSTSSCPFCLNQKVKGLKSPCFDPVCANVKNYEEAKACDIVEQNYCQEIDAKNMIDKGCQNRQDKAPFYVVPATEGGNCTYDIRTLQIGTDRLSALKFAFIECKLVSAGDVVNDTTPYVLYQSLKHYLEPESFDGLSDGNKTKLNILSRFLKNELVSMELLNDFELIPEIDATLLQNGDQQESLYYHQDLRNRNNRFYQNAIGIGLKTENDWLYHDTDPSTCEARNDLLDEVFRLPPCDDPVMTLTSVLLKRANFHSIINDYWEYEDFKHSTNVDESIDLKCNPKKGVIQLAVLLSETRYEYRDGVESLFEYKRGYGHNRDCWNNPTTCSNLESAITSGDMFVSIGSSLYQKGCKSKLCKFRVDPCAQLGLRPADPEINIPLLKQQITSLINDTNLLKTARNWNEILLAEIQISARAISEPLHRMNTLFHSLSYTGQKNRYLKDVENYCPHEWHIYNESTGTWDQNKEWNEDPCCNWEIRQYQCCAPKDVADGKVTIVTGFDDAKLQSVCQNPNEAKSIMKDLQKQQARAAAAAAELAESTDKSAYDEYWEMEHTCRSKIEGWDKDWDEDHCKSDSDCYCSYATCNKNPNSKNRCEVSAESEYLCFAECFRKEVGATSADLLGFIAKDLGVDPSDEMAFNEKWGAKTTENGCYGPTSWEHTARFEWVHNETCVDQHTCSSSDWKEKKMREAGFDWNDDERLRQIEMDGNATACSNFRSGWQLTCNLDHSGKCNYDCMPAIPSGNDSVPCTRGEECRKTCANKGKDPEICAANNGAWMPNEGECCPQGLFVHNETRMGEIFQSCRYDPVGTPEPWEIKDKTCCDAIGGIYFRLDRGEMGCCLGEIKTYYDPWADKEGTFCEISYDNYRQERDCIEKNCEQYEDLCESCYSNREQCYGEQYIPASKDNCLNDTRCNHRALSDDCTQWEWSGSTDPVPSGGFCAHDSGWPAGMVEARCIVRNKINPFNATSCAAAGYTWADISESWEGSTNNQCLKTITNSSTNMSDCFPTATCSWKLRDYDFSNRFPSLSNPPDGGYLVEGYCPASCTLSVSSATTIGISRWGGSNNDDYYYTWCRGSNGMHFMKNSSWSQDYGVCVNEWSSKAQCDGAQGQFNELRYEYRPARYMDKISCEYGSCRGSIDSYHDPDTGYHLWNQPWSKSQCVDLSVKECDRHCPYCTMSGSQSDGACFNTSAAITDKYERKLESISTKANCDAQSSDGAVWYECPQPQIRYYDWYELNDKCNDMPKDASYNIPTDYQDLLDCTSHYETCKTEEDCANMGECTDRWEFRTEYCTAPEWKTEWGDGWYYGHEVKTTQDDGSLLTEWKHESCPCDAYDDTGVCHRKEVDGVCIRDRDSYGRCSDNWNDWHLYHRFGCRVPGYYNETACKGADTTYTWMEPAANKSECGNRKVCKIGWWETSYSVSECTECNGNYKSIYRWNGGKVRGPRHEPYRWHDSVKQEPENQWLKVQASWKLTDLLSNPIMKAYANNKVSQYLTTYNLYQSALVSLAENCGISSGTTTTTSTLSAEEEETATVIGERESFAKCGDKDEQIPVLGQTLVMSPSCDDNNNRRRLATGSNSSSLQFFYSSAAENATRYEPCTDSDIFDTMFVKRTDGVYIGQLLGDGIGIKSDKAIGEVDFCLDARDDLQARDDLFDTIALGKLDEDASTTEGVKVVRNVTTNVTFASKSMSRVCVSVKEPGIYFPILIADVPDSVNCGLGCVADRSVCVINGTASTPAPQCLCKCGYSGTTCELGCPNSCSGNGECEPNTGVCTCKKDDFDSPMYTLDDCSKIKCPANPDTGVTCSGRGLCIATSSATCKCDGGYTGSACQTAPVREIYGFNTGGYAQSLTTEDQAVQTTNTSFTLLAATVEEVIAEREALTPTPAPTPTKASLVDEKDSSSTPIGAIVGGVVAGASIVAIGSFFILYPELGEKLLNGIKSSGTKSITPETEMGKIVPDT